MPNVEITPDGWAVPSSFWQYYRFVTDHEPPRPGAVGFQLRLDSQNWKPVAFWVVGAVLMMAGAAAGRWDLLAVGVVVIAAWGMMFASAVRTVRNYPVVVGVIDSLTPHPQVRQIATARAVTADGQTIPVAAATALVWGFLAGNGRAEVLFLHDFRSAACWVLAARPPTRRGSAVSVRKLPPAPFLTAERRLPPAPCLTAEAPDVPWDDDARRVLAAVEAEAGSDGYLGTRHLLLAAARRGPRVAGLDDAALRAAAAAVAGPPADTTIGRWPTPRLRRAVVHAATRAMADGRPVGPRDLWHALLTDSDSECQLVLDALGLEAGELLKVLA
ncbi:MAG TPA: hypothetical protein VH120_16355 [Gemmataceae bacterium]|nr:hypothetical protein [Gemmataceae bacterium]